MPTMSSVKGTEHDEHKQKDDDATFDVDSDGDGDGDSNCDLATHSDAASAVVGGRTVRWTVAQLWMRCVALREIGVQTPHKLSRHHKQKSAE
ncbi:hypothetical protein AWZ03_007946 [Drosophila navojoa]|uniref:Uncharacterized protein n=1 Tax=Drosophila navojoa TaxID=7232 RepID=A0A484BD10_DRONA|nr:hypothetical protein AWZ03_007946 [Drosophila navojoa]